MTISVERASASFAALPKPQCLICDSYSLGRRYLLEASSPQHLTMMQLPSATELNHLHSQGLTPIRTTHAGRTNRNPPPNRWVVLNGLSFPNLAGQKAKTVALSCRDNRIRTCDLTVPNGTRYQAAPYPELLESVREITVVLWVFQVKVPVQ